jgi:cyclopropane fatty-acyl-phospholipid synthase-like methyltransferase
LQFVCEGKIPAGRALVPGCGRGYDIALLASSERFVVGLEYSPTAAAEAAAYLAAEHPDKMAFCKIVTGDFFAFEDDERYDFVYDYTFFCAIKPERRGEWAKRMDKLLAPGGTLLTMVFPLKMQPPGTPVDFALGPPFLLKPEFYDVLQPYGLRRVETGEVEESLSDPRRVGAEAYAIWKRVD